MDNVTHTLFGVALAETGLKRWVPMAMPTLLIGSNLPDLDVLAGFGGEDFSLSFRRGWTHGVLGQVVLSPALATVLYAVRRRPADGAPARFWPLLALSLLSIGSHSLLDWLNNYGVRLLMPFDGRWFYGDSVFIVDPWLWLAVLVPSILVHSVRRRSLGLWALLTAAMTLLIVLPDVVGPGVKLGWLLGIGALWGVRLVRKPVASDWLGRGATAGFVLYGAGMLFGSALAERQVRSWLAGRGESVEAVVAMPMPGNPFVRDVVVLGEQRYLFALVDWWASETVKFSDEPVPRSLPPAPVRAALARAELRGLANWLRFPTWAVTETTEGYDVSLHDARYSRAWPSGFGKQVKVPRTSVPGG